MNQFKRPHGDAHELAWNAIKDTLNEVVPDWNFSASKSAVESAVDAIKALAAKAKESK